MSGGGVGLPHRGENWIISSLAHLPVQSMTSIKQQFLVYVLLLDLLKANI